MIGFVTAKVIWTFGMRSGKVHGRTHDIMLKPSSSDVTTTSSPMTELYDTGCVYPDDSNATWDTKAVRAEDWDAVKDQLSDWQVYHVALAVIYLRKPFAS